MQFFPMDPVPQSTSLRLGDFVASSRTATDIDFSALLSSHLTQEYPLEGGPQPASLVPEERVQPGERQDQACSSQTAQTSSTNRNTDTPSAYPDHQAEWHNSSDRPDQAETLRHDEEKSAGSGSQDTQETVSQEKTESGAEHSSGRSAQHADKDVSQAHTEAQHSTSAQSHADTEILDDVWSDISIQIEGILSAMREVVGSLDAHGPEAQTVHETVLEKLAFIRAQVHAMRVPGAQNALHNDATLSTVGKGAASSVLSSHAESILGMAHDNGSAEILESLTQALQEIRQGVQRLATAHAGSVRSELPGASATPSQPAEKIPSRVMALLDKVAHLEERLHVLKHTEKVQDATTSSFVRTQHGKAAKAKASRQDRPDQDAQADKSAAAGSQVRAAHHKHTATSGVLPETGNMHAPAADFSKATHKTTGAVQAAQAEINPTADIQASGSVKKNMDGAVASTVLLSKDESHGLDQSLGKNRGPHDGLHDTENAHGAKTEARFFRETGQQARQDSRHGFFHEHRQETLAERPGDGSFKTIGTDVAAAIKYASGQQADASARTPSSPANLAKNAEVYKQVEQGAFKNLGQGTRQLTLRLDPIELGQVSVVLQVRGKEVQAVLRATTAEASQALNEQMAQLRTQLENEGLKVTRLEVQTQLSDSQTSAQWQGAEQHNRHQENRELAMTAQRFRSLGRIESEVAQDVQNVVYPEKKSPTGVDIFA
ncbi:hypothetical protein MASR1M90_13870 [Desulfovibrionales bacterium]